MLVHRVIVSGDTLEHGWFCRVLNDLYWLPQNPDMDYRKRPEPEPDEPDEEEEAPAIP